MNPKKRAQRGSEDMIAAIIALIMALVSFFGAKKAGASDGEAAAIAGAAGLGTYYVGTQTEWGRDMISDIESWVGVTDSSGDPVLNGDGQPAKVPEGAEIMRNEDGSVAKDANGNVMWKLVDSAGKVLTSWGPVGTAGVIGAAGVATDTIDEKWLWIGAALAAIVILK